MLSRVIFRSKKLKISLRACRFKSGPKKQLTTGKKPPSFCGVAFVSKPALVVCRACNYCDGQERHVEDIRHQVETNFITGEVVILDPK